jgi:hypothetical protein
MFGCKRVFCFCQKLYDRIKDVGFERFGAYGYFVIVETYRGDAFLKKPQVFLSMKYFIDFFEIVFV